MKFLKYYIGDVLVVLGTILTSYHVFNVSHETSSGTCLPSLSCESIAGVVYYYSQSSLILITLGITLIVLGLIIMKNKKI